MATTGRGRPGTFCLDHQCSKSILRMWWQYCVSNLEVRRRVLRERETHLRKISSPTTTSVGFAITSECNPTDYLSYTPRCSGNRVEKTRWPKQTLAEADEGFYTKFGFAGLSLLPGWGSRDFVWLETFNRDGEESKPMAKLLQLPTPK